MAINLSRDAQQLLGAYQQVADLTPAQEQQLQKIAGGDKACTRAALEQILDPGCLKQAAALVKCDPRGDDAVFNTTFVGRPKVVKEQVQVRVQNRTRPIGPRDPYYAKLEVDPRAAMVVLASGSKFEPGADRPRPRLMKLVVRTESEDGKPTDKDWENLEKLLGDAKTKKFVWDPKGDEVPVKELDVQWIGSKEASVETKDINEPEFDFGSGIVGISVAKGGGELSRDNAIDPENIQRTQVYWGRGNTNVPDFNRPVGGPTDRAAADQTPPETFDHKIGVDVNAKNLPRGVWVDTPNVGKHLDVNLRLGSRWLMEAGSNGTVSLLGQKIETKVAEDDVYFNGSHSGLVGAPVPEQFSIHQVLGQNVRKDFGRVATDKSNANIGVQNRYFQQHIGVTFAGQALGGVRDIQFQHGATPGMTVAKRPIADPQRDGLAFDIDFGPEFLTNANGNLKGFTLDVGQRSVGADGEDVWTPATHPGGDGLYKLPAKGCGDDAKFCFNFANFPEARERGTPVEVIVRDQNNIPVARVQIPLDEVQWA